jgi:hypothetical protein
MNMRCDLYWRRFVASQLNAHTARCEADRIVWLQVAEMWLTLARAEQLVGSGPDLFGREESGRAVLH